MLLPLLGFDFTFTMYGDVHALYFFLSTLREGRTRSEVNSILALILAFFITTFFFGFFVILTVGAVVSGQESTRENLRGYEALIGATCWAPRRRAARSGGSGTPWLG